MNSTIPKDINRVTDKLASKANDDKIGKNVVEISSNNPISKALVDKLGCYQMKQRIKQT